MLIKSLINRWENRRSKNSTEEAFNKAKIEFAEKYENILQKVLNQAAIGFARNFDISFYEENGKILDVNGVEFFTLDDLLYFCLGNKNTINNAPVFSKTNTKIRDRMDYIKLMHKVNFPIQFHFSFYGLKDLPKDLLKLSEMVE
jgi:hypothetical protein